MKLFSLLSLLLVVSSSAGEPGTPPTTPPHDSCRIRKSPRFADNGDYDSLETLIQSYGRMVGVPEEDARHSKRGSKKRNLRISLPESLFETVGGDTPVSSEDEVVTPIRTRLIMDRMNVELAGGKLRDAYDSLAAQGPRPLPCRPKRTSSKPDVVLGE